MTCSTVARPTSNVSSTAPVARRRPWPTKPSSASTSASRRTSHRTSSPWELCVSLRTLERGLALVPRLHAASAHPGDEDARGAALLLAQGRKVGDVADPPRFLQPVSLLAAVQGLLSRGAVGDEASAPSPAADARRPSAPRPGAVQLMPKLEGRGEVRWSRCSVPRCTGSAWSTGSARAAWVTSTSASTNACSARWRSRRSAATGAWTPCAKARFLREARILSQLEHPNICRLYDYVEERGGGLPHPRATCRAGALRDLRARRAHPRRSKLGVGVADRLRAGRGARPVRGPPGPQARERDGDARRAGEGPGLRPGAPGACGGPDRGVHAGRHAPGRRPRTVVRFGTARSPSSARSSERRAT